MMESTSVNVSNSPFKANPANILHHNLCRLVL